MSDFLVGKTINEIMLASDKKAILFKCSDGDHIAKADGDCCSDTWVENIEVTVLSFPCTVLSVNYLETRDDEEADYECVQFYGLRINTDKGSIELDYRNSSNGYYGGNLSWPDDTYFYGGVYGQNVSNNDWKSL